MLRTTNLELQIKHGPAVWAALNAQIEGGLGVKEARVRALRQEVEALHAKRKLQHIAAGKELALLREAEREKRAAVGAVKAAVRDLQAQL